MPETNRVSPRTRQFPRLPPRLRKGRHRRAAAPTERILGAASWTAGVLVVVAIMSNPDPGSGVTTPPPDPTRTATPGPPPPLAWEKAGGAQRVDTDRTESSTERSDPPLSILPGGEPTPNVVSTSVAAEPPSTSTSEISQGAGVSSAAPGPSIAGPASTTDPAPVTSVSTTKPTPPPETSHSEQHCSPDLPDIHLPDIHLPGVRIHVGKAANVIAHQFDVPEDQIIGRASRPDRSASDHPRGLALDFKVSRSVGDKLAGYALAHRVELGITYVIWRQRINHGAGWTGMEDRGGITANHYDHVHVSFGSRAPAGNAVPCLP
jgi:hypothetical protein